MFVMPGADGAYVPTDMQTRLWEVRKRKVPNSICVSWCLWTGFDGTDEKILIVTKTPFSFLGDDYEKARQQYSNKMFLQRAAWTMEQGLGRTRRGRPEDYDTDGVVRGYVAIADGDWKRIRKYLSKSLKDAIVED